MIMENNIETNQHKLSRSLIFLMAIACGTVAANLYYAQPLLSDIARTFHVSKETIGFVPMLMQSGYALGMLLILPLGDIKKRRPLIVMMLILSSVALFLISSSINLGMLLAASFALGFTNVTPHLVVAFAAQLSNPKERGKTVGSVMSGLLIGILISRTFSGIIGSAFGWRIVFILAVLTILLLALLMRLLLPDSQATSKIKYNKLLLSMWHLIKTEPVLRQASITGALMFATFNIFWTTLIFLLESPAYRLGAQAAGLFGLVGVTGALASPIVGKLADKRGTWMILTIAMGASALSFLCFGLFGMQLWGLIIGVILLDIGTQSGQISNQTKIYALKGEARNRINTVFMVSYFIGGSMGSILGTYSFAHYGWTGVCTLGMFFILTALMIHFINKRSIIKSIINKD
jgi:predicted MFS family arabinose efflux permease